MREGERGRLPVHPDPRRSAAAPRPPSASTRPPRACARGRPRCCSPKGSQQGLDLVARVLVDPGDVVLVGAGPRTSARPPPSARRGRGWSACASTRRASTSTTCARRYRAETADGRKREVPLRDPQLPEPVRDLPLASRAAGPCSRPPASWTCSWSRTTPTETCTSRTEPRPTLRSMDEARPASSTCPRSRRSSPRAAHRVRHRARGDLLAKIEIAKQSANLCGSRAWTSGHPRVPARAASIEEQKARIRPLLPRRSGTRCWARSRRRCRPA